VHAVLQVGEAFELRSRRVLRYKPDNEPKWPIPGAAARQQHRQLSYLST
jgi:hypothetical protein